MDTVIVNETNGVLDFNAGATINSFDRVVRINSGFGITGYEDNIGTKADVISIQPVFLLSDEKRHELESRTGFDTVAEIMLFSAWRGEVLTESNRLLFPDKTITEVGESVSTFAYRSTGISTHYTAYLAAIHYSIMGDNVTVYGFNPNKTKHFWDDYELPKICPKSAHDLIAIEVNDLRSRGVSFLEDSMVAQ